MYMVSVMYMVVVQYSSIKEPKAGKIMNASVEYPIQQGHILSRSIFWPFGKCLTFWKRNLEHQGNKKKLDRKLKLPVFYL